MANQSEDREPGRILIVDNDRDVAGAVRLLLAHRGFEVEVAGNGEVALRLLAERQAAGMAIELVLLDLRMPGLGGIGVLDRLERMATPPAVIVLSGFIGDEDRERLRGSPYVQAVVRKPFDVSELGAAAQAAIAARRGRRPAPDPQHQPGDAALLP
jgi:DNA-binding response OmpR family regulator